VSKRLAIICLRNFRMSDFRMLQPESTRQNPDRSGRVMSIISKLDASDARNRDRKIDRERERGGREGGREGGKGGKGVSPKRVIGESVAKSEAERLASTTVSIVIEMTGKKTGRPRSSACDEASGSRVSQKNQR